MPERLRTPIGEMWMDGGVLWHRLDSLEVSTADAEGVRSTVLQLTGGAQVPAVVDIRSIGFAGFDARQTFAAPPEESHELATALIVSSSSSRAMADLFMSVSKPARPVRVFTAEKAAVEWARSFLADAGSPTDG